MQAESRTKTFFMVLSLAAFMGAGSACFALFDAVFGSDAPGPAQDSCEELEDQARADCEKRRER